MSKKTRRQKIAADLRRKLPSFTETAEIPSPEPQREIYQKESLYIYPVQLIRKDLTKTLLLSILAISLELALFFLLEKHISLPFIK